MNTIDSWKKHWDAKTATNPVELNGYCIDGTPIPAEQYRKAVMEPTLRLLDLRSSHRVLDVGCGTGIMLAEIEQQVAEAVGTDISVTMTSKYSGRSVIHVCPAHELPFGEASFDRILMFSVSIFFPDFAHFKSVIEKCISLLRPAGRLVVGDLLLGPQTGRYLSLDPSQLFDFLDSTKEFYRVQSQCRLKRRINKRWDLVVLKD